MSDPDHDWQANDTFRAAGDLARPKAIDLDPKRAAAVKHLQELVAKYVPEGVSLVDQLLEDRCLEVAKEEQESRGYGSIEYWLGVTRKRRGIKE